MDTDSLAVETLPAENSGRRGITAFGLKIIACVSMLTDHIGWVLYEGGYLASTGWMPMGVNLRDPLCLAGLTFHWLGRFSFPIFAFFIAEGFVHTRSRGRYLGRLCIFALISEIPYDLAFSGTLLELHDQNVLFTLALGLAALIILESVSSAFHDRSFLKGLMSVLGVILCCAAAALLCSDYSYSGVLLVVIFYLTRKKAPVRDICFALWAVPVTVTQIPTILDIPIFHAYNGQPGKNSKAVRLGFYAFYPGHLLILWGIKVLIWG